VGDNVFLERFWHGVKYEKVYLRAYDSVYEARASLSTFTTAIGPIRAFPINATSSSVKN
jgi:hypothetical protein